MKPEQKEKLLKIASAILDNITVTKEGMVMLEDILPTEEEKTRNRVGCLSCGVILESTFRHDFKTCNCPNQTMVDGGYDYNRYGGVEMELVIPIPGNLDDEEASEWFQNVRKNQ